METDWWVEEKEGRRFSILRLSKDDCSGGGEGGQKLKESGGN